MFYTIAALAGVLATAVFCALTVSQTRSRKRLNDELMTAIQQKRAATAELAGAIKGIDASMNSALQAVAYEPGQAGRHSRAGHVGVTTALVPVQPHRGSGEASRWHEAVAAQNSRVAMRRLAATKKSPLPPPEEVSPKGSFVRKLHNVEKKTGWTSPRPRRAASARSTARSH